MIAHTPLKKAVGLRVLAIIIMATVWPGIAAETSQYLSPASLAVSLESGLVAVGCSTGKKVALVCVESNATRQWLETPAAPLGMTMSRGGRRLFVACAAAQSEVVEFALPEGRRLRSFRVGHTAMSPVLSADEKMLYVCNRFDNEVAILDLETGKVRARVSVEREPVSAVLTPDGKHLWVANHVQAGAASDAHASTSISIIDVDRGQLQRHIQMPLGTSLMRGIAMSPDGRFAAVTHVRALHWLSTKTVEMGRINCNAVTFMDVSKGEPLGTVLLDRTALGAANPWAVAWSPDGATVAVSCAGAHEICLLSAPVVADRSSFFSMTIGAYENDGTKPVKPPAHPVRVRARIPSSGEGPRALAFRGATLYVANYFSDEIGYLEMGDAAPEFTSVPLGNMPEASLLRKGEMWFNDARICLQRWQSCASCHDEDGRMDALNWDLLNDGKGNPKNTRSLLYAHHSGPVMALGVRADAGVAVRAGVHHILFTDPPDEVPAAMDIYLRSLRPVPSPKLVNGELSTAAQRGRLIFEDRKTRCLACHPGPLFTDLKPHEVGTAAKYSSMWDGNGADPSDKFVSPTLRELWRTAPYLHDGSAVTLEAVLRERNKNDAHGRTTHLTDAELRDLVEYLQSL